MILLNKILPILLLTLISIDANSQTFSITNKGVRIEYSIEFKDDSTCIQKIKLVNSSKQKICIAQVAEKSHFYFKIDSILYSNFGIMNSMFGPPNLGSDVRLLIIEPKEEFNLEVPIKTKHSGVKKYCFTFDFMLYDKIKKKKKSEEDSSKYVLMEVEKYYSSCSSVQSTMTK